MEPRHVHLHTTLGPYVDSHGQRHPLDIEIPSVYYVLESPSRQQQQPIKPALQQ